MIYIHFFYFYISFMPVGWEHDILISPGGIYNVCFLPCLILFCRDHSKALWSFVNKFFLCMRLRYRRGAITSQCWRFTTFSCVFAHVAWFMKQNWIGSPYNSLWSLPLCIALCVHGRDPQVRVSFRLTAVAGFEPSTRHSNKVVITQFVQHWFLTLRPVTFSLQFFYCCFVYDLFFLSFFFIN